jgi:hypothetical protein
MIRNLNYVFICYKKKKASIGACLISGKEQRTIVSNVPANRSISIRWSGPSFCAVFVKALLVRMDLPPARPDSSTQSASVNPSLTASATAAYGLFIFDFGFPSLKCSII